MAKSEKELSTPEKREKKLKDYYKKLPLFKVKDILLGIKRKSQVYKDMGQKVPKNLISIQRSLYYIIKKKEEEQMKKNREENPVKLSEYAKNFLREVDRRKEIEANTQSQINLFSEDINEDDLSTEKLQDVSRKIRKGDWEEMNPKAFRESLSKSKHSKMLTVYGVSDLAKMKLYKLNGYDIGFALKKNDGKYQEIVAVHNNEEGVSGIGKLLMNAAIKEGGCILDHFDSAILTNLYKSLGFEETERYDYDPQYDPDQSFKNTYGELAVVYRKHKNCA